MTQFTRDAILLVIANDETMTHEDRLVFTRILSGERQARIIGRKEAARMIGCHPNTVDNLVKAHLLVAVRGVNGHLAGVTELSINNYIEGKAVA